MHTMKLITLIFLLVSFVHSTAQSDSLLLKRKYEAGAIYFSGRGYIKNETSYRLKYLKYEFKESKEGQLMYEMARSDKRKFVFFYATSLVAIIVGPIVSRQNNQLTAGLFFGGMISLGASINFSISSINKMHKAVWLRNRDVLLRKN